MKRLMVLLFLLFLFGCKSGGDYSSGSLEGFAKCLSEEGAVMYGAFWCGHCANQKSKFGEAVQYINYVECDPRGENSQAQLCIEKGIEGYPTWEFEDGSRLGGDRPLAQLAAKTGCELPV